MSIKSNTEHAARNFRLSEDGERVIAALVYRDEVGTYHYYASVNSTEDQNHFLVEVTAEEAHFHPALADKEQFNLRYRPISAYRAI